MALIDFILDLVALMLWWNWLAIQFDPLAKTTAVSLIGTLRKADPSGPRRWRSLAALGALLLFRAIVYWQLCGSLRWSPKIPLGIIDLYFRIDPFLRGPFFLRSLLFSILSFTLALGIFYSWLLLLSIANETVPDTDPIQKLVRGHFKWVEKLPIVIKFLLPFAAGAIFWFVFHPLLARMAIVPKAKSSVQVLEQSACIGAAAYLCWKHLIVGVLLLHVLNSYVYLGNHAFWNFINLTARNLLYPLRWLPARIGKVDFLPLVGMALVFFVSELVTNPPERLAWFKFRQWFYHALPF